MKSSLALMALRVIPQKKQQAMLTRVLNYLLNLEYLTQHTGKTFQFQLKESALCWIVMFDGKQFVSSEQDAGATLVDTAMADVAIADVIVKVAFEHLLNFPSTEEVKAKVLDGSIELIGEKHDQLLVLELLDSVDQIKVTKCVRRLRRLVGFKVQDIKDKSLTELTIRDISCQQDIDYLRDQALELEATEPGLAYQLMKLAHGARPTGPFIKRKLNEYRHKGYDRLYALGETKALFAIEVAGDSFGYFPLPKAACSSIKLTLYEQSNNRAFNKDNYQGRHVHDYWFKAQKPLGYFNQVLIVVRDPIERFLSVYASRVLDHGELNRNAVQRDCSWLLKTLPHFRPSLSQFIEHLDSYMLVPTIEHHCQPLSWQVNNDLSQFTYVVPLEAINQAEMLLQQAAGNAVTIPKAHVSNHKVTLRQLTKAQFDTLLDFFADDYRLLAPWYSIDAIRNKWQQANAETVAETCAKTLVKKVGELV